MQSSLSWIANVEKTALVESHGMWDAANLLQFADILTSEKPKYLIWNPTNVILNADTLAATLEDASLVRQQVFQIVKSLLLNDSEARLFVVAPNIIPAFKAMQKIYQDNGLGHQLIFVASQEEAINIIQDKSNSANSD